MIIAICPRRILRFVIVNMLAACGGRIQPNPQRAPTAHASCDETSVPLYDEHVDDAGATVGTMITCKGTCPTGSSRTFATSAGWVDGVCQ